VIILTAASILSSGRWHNG